MKKNILTIIIALTTSIVTFAQNNTASYLYHGEAIEVQINSEALLVYFDASQITAEEIETHYDCLRTVVLDSAMAQSLLAYEISIADEEYPAALTRLRQLPEVRDIEPVIGDSLGIPVSNVFYVKLHSHCDTATLMNLVAQNGATYKGCVSERRAWYAVEVNKESSGNALALSTTFGETGLFADVDPGFIFKLRFNTTNCPDDPLVEDQWAIDALDLCDVWDGGYKGLGIKIALIDEGIDLTHSELSNTTITGSYNANYPYTGPAIRYGTHGTMVAGVIFAAHNSSMLAGIAPQASLINISIQNCGVNENVQGMEYNIMFAFDKALDDNADVILCAWDLNNDGTNLYSSTIEDAIEDALENGRNGKGTVVVFASGRINNSATYGVSYPAKFDDRIITVGKQRQTFSFSLWQHARCCCARK